MKFFTVDDLDLQMKMEPDVQKGRKGLLAALQAIMFIKRFGK